MNFSAALQSFAAELTSLFKLTVKANPEDQLKSPLQKLIATVSTTLHIAKVQVLTEVQVVELGGRPDMGVVVDMLLTGYIELKAPGKGARPEKLKGADAVQWAKFKHLPNLLYTDGNEWALYRNGERNGQLVRLTGLVTEDGAAAVTEQDAARLLELFRDFLHWAPVPPTNPRALAELLAPLCRLLREEVQGALHDPTSAVASLAQDWRTFFFPEADDEQFADAYAQTFTYALLLARVAGSDDLSVAKAAQTIRPGHRLLADTLRMLGDEAARALLEVPVALLERVLAAVDPSLFTQYAGDLWLYFYEDFLAAYDPQMRNDRGVYYTPLEVVRCQVCLVAQLLAERFGKPFSFVDEGVLTLDPATGTGTYLLAAMQHGLAQIAAVKGKGKRASAATTAAQNMHAFELLVGPYAVAHLRLTQQVLAEGGTLPKDGVHVYLADTLESPYTKPHDYLPLPYKPFGEEQQRAQQIKRTTPILVCLGNPPYDRQTLDPGAPVQRRKGGWVRFGDPAQAQTTPQPALLTDFLTPLEASGQGVHAKNLYNDYVYFWRWALWKVYEQQPGYGIVSFITAASYLRGPGFAGMRELMRRTFDELWIIDLEGDSLGARKSENVFAIQTPVAIAIGMRAGPTQTATPATVHYTRLTGTRAEKLATLDTVTTFATLPWRECLRDWQAPLLPTSMNAYWDWPLLTELFPWQANGMQFKRAWPLGESADLLRRRWAALLAASDRRTAFKESRDRLISGRYPALDGRGEREPALSSLPLGTPAPTAQQIAFRSFDRQWALVDPRLGDYLRPVLHQTHGNRQIYLTSLLTKVLGEGPAAVATALLPDMDYFCNRGAKDVIPLWRDQAGSEANLPAGLLEMLAHSYGAPVTPERLFAYAYGMLATPRYVERFWDELTIPGPRLPLTKDWARFNAVADLGAHLLWLHTYGERYVPMGKSPGVLPYGAAQIEVGVPQNEADYPESFSYHAAQRELWVGKGRFSNVAPEVWAFSVSGLHVVASWLGYRMQKRAGKSSSPLDALRPTTWHFDDELLDLLWVLEQTVTQLPQAAALLDDVLAGALFTTAELPVPTETERQGPKVAGTTTTLPLTGLGEAGETG